MKPPRKKIIQETSRNFVPQETPPRIRGALPTGDEDARGHQGSGGSAAEAEGPGASPCPIPPRVRCPTVPRRERCGEPLVGRKDDAVANLLKTRSNSKVDDY